MFLIKGLKPKSVLPALFGTIVEYYDYALYGLCAAVLAQHFFPSHDETASLLKAYGVFAVGSFAKPLGALFFGFLGDLKGRRFALQISMIGVALPTTVIAFLPDHTVWGYGATAALILCRFFQGFFVAGEADGVALYIYEHVDETRACFSNSLCHLASGSGVYLASYMIAQNYDLGLQHQWRTPFLVGGLMGFAVLAVRQFIHETPAYLNKENQQERETIPFAFKPFWIVIMLVGSIGGMYQFFFIFLGTYLVDLQVLEGSQKAFTVSILLLCYSGASPFMGILADKIGYERQMVLFGCLVLICALMMALSVAFHQYSLSLMMGMAVCLSGMHTPGFVVLAKHFPVQYRYRSMAIGHALGSMIFSGSTPFIALSLYQFTHIKAMPFMYFLTLTLGGVFSVVALQRVEEFSFD